MAKQNLSRPIRFGYGSIVKHPVHGIGVVDHEFNSPVVDGKYVEMALVEFYEDKSVEVKISELSWVSKLQFLAYRLPSGEFMHGRVSLIGQGIRYAFFLAISIIAPLTMAPVLGISLAVFCTGISVGMLFSTLGDYKKMVK